MDTRLRILYVADRADAAGRMSRVLEQTDSRFTVEGVAERDTALERLADGFDCLVIGGQSGADAMQLLASVRERAPTLPVVLSPDNQEPVDAAVAAGVTGDPESDPDTLLAKRITEAVDTTPAGRMSSESAIPRHSEMFPDVAFYIDEEGRYIDIITGQESPLLYDDPETFIGARMQDVLPTEIAERVQETIDRALDTDEVQTVQYPLEVQAGLQWFEARIAPVERAETERRQVLSVVRDITDRKERETALEALHEMATTIQTADTVERACELTVTAAADILEFEMCSALVQEGDLLVPAAVSESAQPDAVRTMHVEDGLAGKTIRTGESYVVDQVSPDDDTDPALDTVESGLSVPIGEHGVFQAVNTEPGAFDDEDITLVELLVSHTRTAIDRIEREKTLTRKTERLEEFASFVSHDLRNPLNVATLRLELLKEERDSQHVRGLEDALGRMERLIDELLTLARQGNTIGETEPVRLANVVTRAWDNVETHGATLVCETDRTLYADRNRLTAVLENLFRNAMEHGSSVTAASGADGDTSVTVTVSDLVDRSGFYVADDGGGVPEPEREQVFESGYSTAEDGTGFGLTIVRDIVDAHDWVIQVTESEDGGARFEITGVETVS